VTQHRTLQQEFEEHFDWIWTNASISSYDFMEAKTVGIEKGFSQSGVTNVFTDPQDARKRIVHLLRQAKKRLRIQGISLNSFFDRGDLFASIKQLVEENKLEEIQILILNPESEQAYYRSFREYLFENPETTFEKYRSDPELHKRSTLYTDTYETINNIRLTKLLKKNNRFRVNLYDSTPACFMLMVDDSVLVEQYHYGKILPEDETDNFPVILGKDMPSIEYTQSPTAIFETNALRIPFKLLENHFRFVFDKSSQPLE